MLETYQINWTAIAAFSAAIVALFGAWHANKIAKHNSSVTVELEIIRFREKWIDKLRGEMNSFGAILGAQFLMPELHRDNFLNLNIHAGAILLLMNPNDEDYDALREMMAQLAVLIIDRDNYENDEELISNYHFTQLCQQILAREWNVLKNEKENLKRI